MASNARKLESYIKNFAYKSVQVIAQTRQGRRLRTESKPVSPGSDWFNLGVVDLPEIQTELRRQLPSYGLSTGPVVSVEVSLRTQDAAVVVELWRISVSGAAAPAAVGFELSSAALAAAYTDLGKLLRSVCVASRALPAYRLSRRPGSAGGHPVLVHLHASPSSRPAATPSAAEGFVEAQLGSVSIAPLHGGAGSTCCAVTASVWYRRRAELVPVASFVADAPMETNVNHFDDSCLGPFDRDSGSHANLADHHCSSPCPPPTTVEGKVPAIVAGKSAAAECRPMETASSPVVTEGKQRRIGSSVSASPGSPSLLTRDIGTAATAATAAASADRGTNAAAECPADAAPFSSLLYMSQMYSEDADTACADLALDQPIESASGLDETDRLESLEKEDDFVMIQLKTPFAPPSDAESDLSRFFRSCQQVPDLQMFHRGPAIRDALEHIGEDLSAFESALPVFDEFVSSLQQMTESPVPAACGRPC